MNISTKNRILNVLLCLAALLFAVVLVEIILRLTNLVPETNQAHAHLIYDHKPDYYKLKPNLKEIPFGGVLLTSNEFGYRDRTMPLAKPESSYRIAVLGDSWGFGWGVEYEQTIVRRLEKLFEERYPDRQVELLNFSIAAYDMDHYYHALRQEVLRFEPDRVVLLLHLSDYYIEEPHAEDRDSDSRAVDLKIRRFVYARLLLPLAIRLQLPNQGVVDSYLRAYGPGSRYLDTYTRYVDKFANLARSSNLEVSVFLFPLPLAQSRPYQLQPVHDVIKEIFQQRGVTVTELLESYPDYPKDKLILHAHDEHPNAFASGLLAEEIFRRLEEAGILGGAD